MAHLLRKLRHKFESNTDNSYSTFADSAFSKTRSSSLTTSSTSREVIHLAHKLDHVLTDAATLSHYIQFMNSQNQAHLVKFWLHANTFRLGCQRLLEEQEISSNISTLLHDDAVNIFSKYLAKDAQCPIDIGDSIRTTVTKRLCPSNNTQMLDSDCLLPAANFVYHIMQRRYYPQFLRTPYYIRHQIEFLGQCHPPFDEMMLCDVAVNTLMEFMESKEASHLLMFWLVAENYRLAREENCEAGYTIEMQIDEAVSIYKKYISLEATQPISISDCERMAVTNAICREGGPLSTCFVRAQRCVLKMIEEKYYDEFLRSPAFEQLLSVLRHSVACFGELAQFDDKPSHGSSNSNLSAPLTSSTFSPAPTFSNDTSSETSSIADRNQSSPADRFGSNLNLVNIDEFGRIIRNYDRNDITKLNESKSKELLTKFSHKFAGIRQQNEDTVEQLAAMIINDVQNAVAAGNQLNSSRGIKHY